MTRQIHFEYHRPGKPTTVYREWLVIERPDVKVLLLDSYPGRDLDVGDVRILDDGAPIVWFVFPNLWYDVGRFHREDGTFTGWYTNFSTPVHLGKERWIGHDLFLDLWQPADGDHAWLDEDEFDAAVESGVLDTWTSRRIARQRAEVETHLDGGTWPPMVAREIDLEQVRMLCEVTDDSE